MDYSTIKRLAKEQGIKVDDLLALAPKNDPFYTGRDSEITAAGWFADLWRRFGYSIGIHLRRVHYQIVSQDPPVLRPDGTAYENTDACWKWLCEAGKYARYLGLVSPEAFVDRRNPDAIVNAQYHGDVTPGYEVQDPWGGFDITLPEFPDLPKLRATGYDDGNLQPYLVEVWAEKTTMNDILKPLCRRYGVNLVTGAGEMSITAVVDFLERVREADRPARILYVSDYDPAGLGMPISVARKIEFFQRQNGDGGLDIRLQPVVLTADQVADYNLPRVPVKDSDLRKANWEACHGEGQVELDALEALYPGRLAEVVKTAILQYHDPDLASRAYDQRWSLMRVLREASEDALEDVQPKLDELRKEFDEIVAELGERLSAMRDELSELHSEILDRLESIEVDLDDYPLPEPDLPDEDDSLLYASERGYLEQLDCYKAYRGGNHGA